MRQILLILLEGEALNQCNCIGRFIVAPEIRMQFFQMPHIDEVYNKPLRILIIDDEKDIGYLLSTLLLKKKNIETSVVDCLKDASTVLEDFNPEIIFLDNHLTDGMGLEFIPFIKKALPEAKIIMLTAHDTQSDRIKALSAGADKFIGKPFTKELIYNAVEELQNRA